MAKGKKGKKKDAKLSKKQRRSLEEQVSLAIEDEYADAFGIAGLEDLDDPDLLIEDELYLDDVYEDFFTEVDIIEMSFADVGRDLFLSGAITSHGGNLSWFDGEQIWITRTGSQLGNLGVGDVIPTTWEPSEFDEGCSSELVVHRAIYHAMKERCEAEGEEFELAAIVHAHTKYTTLLSFGQDEIAPVDSECKYLIPHAVKVVRPEVSIGSPEAAEMLAEIVRGGENIGIIGGHGPFAIADTLPGAMQLVSSLEHSCFLAEMLERKKVRERLFEVLEGPAVGAGEAIADGARSVAATLKDAYGAMKEGWADIKAEAEAEAEARAATRAAAAEPEVNGDEAAENAAEAEFEDAAEATAEAEAEAEFEDAVEAAAEDAADTKVESYIENTDE